jgi:hypothetical protein
MIIQNIMLPLWFFKHTKIQLKKMFPHCVALSMWFYPFAILTKIGKLAYQWNLPKKWKSMMPSMLDYFKNMCLTLAIYLLLELLETLDARDNIVKLEKILITRLHQFSNKTWNFFLLNGNTIPWMKLCRKTNLIFRLTSLGCFVIEGLAHSLFIYCLCGLGFLFFL